MQSYTVHLGDQDRIEDAQFVPDRWAWLGLAFGPLWLAYHRLWISAALCVILFVAISAFGISQGMNPGAASMLSTLLNVAIGFEGNSLRRWRLERKGERVVAVIAARSVEEAETRFFSLYGGHKPAAPLPLATASAPAPAPATGAGVGVIGLFPQPGGRM